MFSQEIKDGVHQNTIIEIKPEQKKSGKISERGWLNSLNKKGFNIAQCFNELIDNSIDAKSSKIQIKNSDKTLWFIDNGKGMTYEQIDTFGCAYSENHPDEENIGNAGIGAKCATKILSDDNNVQIYSKSLNSPFVKCEIPWREIMEKGKYTSEIIIDGMNETEISNYLNDNPLPINQHGFLSGRHRVAAMIGRILRCEKYIPFKVYKT